MLRGQRRADAKKSSGEPPAATRTPSVPCGPSWATPALSAQREQGCSTSHALPLGLETSVALGAVIAMQTSSWGNWSHLSISGQKKPKNCMTGSQESRTASQSQRQG